MTVTREYIAGILCAMQVSGDDEASAAIEKFIVQLEAEIEALKGIDDGTEKCMTCGSMVEQVWHTSDELFNGLSGYPDGNGLLCIRCFDRKAQEQGVHLYWACQPNSYPNGK